jgi:pimeloyl-ACP methyl ester carboxylesterase
MHAELHYPTDDHIKLSAHACGNPDHPPVILLHGGGQTRHAWKKTARGLAERGFYAIAADLRGHGDSGWSPAGDYSPDRYVSDLRCIAAKCQQAPALIGASLGGLTGLLAEGEGPPFLSALVLVDFTPTVQYAGVQKVLQFMGSCATDGFASVEAAAESIAAYLPHRPRPNSLTGLQKNLRLHADGRYRWHWDPAMLQDSDKGQIDALSERMTRAARRLKLPVLLVRGGNSELVSQEDAEHFLSLVPGARYTDIAEARHMVAGDMNDHFGVAVLDFLQKSIMPS